MSNTPTNTNNPEELSQELVNSFKETVADFRAVLDEVKAFVSNIDAESAVYSALQQQTLSSATPLPAGYYPVTITHAHISSILQNNTVFDCISLELAISCGEEGRTISLVLPFSVDTLQKSAILPEGTAQAICRRTESAFLSVLDGMVYQEAGILYNNPRALYLEEPEVLKGLELTAYILEVETQHGRHNVVCRTGFSRGEYSCRE